MCVPVSLSLALFIGKSREFRRAIQEIDCCLLS